MVCIGRVKLIVPRRGTLGCYMALVLSIGRPMPDKTKLASTRAAHFTAEAGRRGPGC